MTREEEARILKPFVDRLGFGAWPIAVGLGGCRSLSQPSFWFQKGFLSSQSKPSPKKTKR